MKYNVFRIQEAKELIMGLGEINIENGNQSIARSIRPIVNSNKFVNH